MVYIIYLIYQEQHVINCDITGTNSGCNGGSPAGAMDFLYNSGTALSNDVSYIGVQRTCSNTVATYRTLNRAYYESYTATAGIQGTPTPNGNCTRLRQLLRAGPVVVSMAANSAFYSLNSAVYSSTTW